MRVPAASRPGGGCEEPAGMAGGTPLPRPPFAVETALPRRRRSRCPGRGAEVTPGWEGGGGGEAGRAPRERSAAARPPSPVGRGGLSPQGLPRASKPKSSSAFRSPELPRSNLSSIENSIWQVEPWLITQSPWFWLSI